MSLEKAFTTAFKDKIWTGEGDESVSGSGSELRHASKVAAYLKSLIEIEGVKSVVDCPCGDFNWQHLFLTDDVSYVGLDIVEGVVERAKKQAENRENVTFKVADLTTSKLPAADLIIVRDCLVHLSNEDTLKALRNIAASDVKLIAVTSFINREVNEDTISPRWRSQNIQRPPFSLPTPKAILLEQCTEANGLFPDKSLLVYEVDAIKPYL